MSLAGGRSTNAAPAGDVAPPSRATSPHHRRREAQHDALMAMNAEAGLQLDFGAGEFEVDSQPLVLSQWTHTSTDDTGYAIWDGSLILAKLLELELGKPALTGARVLELGAGCGVVAIAAAILGAEVTATDLPYCLPLLQHNLTTNESAVMIGGNESGGNESAVMIGGSGGSVRCDALDWRRRTPSYIVYRIPTADIVLGADVLWDPALVPPMFAALRWSLSATAAAKPPPRSEGPEGACSHADSSASCCCCQLDANPEGDEQMMSDLVSDMGLDDPSIAGQADKQGRGVRCSERAWALAQRELRREPYALLAYTYRLEPTHEALMAELSSLCWSEVPLHRVPWESIGTGVGRQRQRNCSDETSPRVRIFRVQLPCPLHSTTSSTCD